MENTNVVRVYRTEYYENRLYKWVALCETTNLDLAKIYLDTPIVGNPRMRVAEYDKSGIRKVKYNFVGVVA